MGSGQRNAFSKLSSPGTKIRAKSLTIPYGLREGAAKVQTNSIFWWYHI